MILNSTILNIYKDVANLTLINNYRPSRISTAIGATVAFSFIIIGVLGNLWITISILHKKELRNNLVNIFIVSLQINDIFNIGFNQFFVGLTYAYMEWKGPMVVCEIVVYTSIIITSVQLWHHALIAIHRYLVVVCNQTIYYMGMSPKVYVLSSLIIARLIPTLVCYPAFTKKMIEYSPSALRCILAPKISGFQNLLIVIINMLIPCIIVTFCFLRIFARVHTVSKNIRKTTSINSCNNSQKKKNIDFSTETKNENANVSMKREIQITKMFSILFLVFLFGYLPYGIIRSFDKSNSLHPDYYILLTLLFVVSISVSPIIYGLMNTQIRKQCILLVCLIFKRKNLAIQKRTNSTTPSDKKNSIKTVDYNKLPTRSQIIKDFNINDTLTTQTLLTDSSNSNSKVRFDVTRTSIAEEEINNCELSDGGMKFFIFYTTVRLRKGANFNQKGFPYYSIKILSFILYRKKRIFII